ncbi:unnamed protein product [marine sediment metagenome]|uniref:Uncharacterized protein n=1 Tax=marine sediment metagenome TaxID=412755 RepID=X1HV49_9ZZZZ
MFYAYFARARLRDKEAIITKNIINDNFLRKVIYPACLNYNVFRF